MVPNMPTLTATSFRSLAFCRGCQNGVGRGDQDRRAGSSGDPIEQSSEGPVEQGSGVSPWMLAGDAAYLSKVTCRLCRMSMSCDPTHPTFLLELDADQEIQLCNSPCRRSPFHPWPSGASKVQGGSSASTTTSTISCSDSCGGSGSCGGLSGPSPLTQLRPSISVLKLSSDPAVPDLHPLTTGSGPPDQVSLGWPSLSTHASRNSFTTELCRGSIVRHEPQQGNPRFVAR